MGRTDNFKRQHREIASLAEKILDALNGNFDLQNATAIRNNLSLLAGKLNVHLAMEDKSLYHTLLAHQDAKISRTARIFIAEMGQVKERFSKYNAQWATPNQIQSDWAGFRQATRTLFEMLFKRVAKEDKELYPLLENIN